MPQTVADLGKKIKAKHPEYSDVPDEELGKKVQSKFPGSYDDFVDVRGLGKLGGSLPANPSQPIPQGLQGSPDNYFGPGIPAITHEGSQQMWHGLLNTGASPGSRISDTLEGLGKGVSPSIIPAAIANPAAAIGGIGLGAASKGLGQFGSELMGADPDTARAIGDVTGMAGGYLGSTPVASRILSSPDVWESVGNAVPFLKAGTGIRNVAKSISSAAAGPQPPERVQYPPPPLRWNASAQEPSPRSAPIPPLQGSSLERMQKPAKLTAPPPPLRFTPVQEPVQPKPVAPPPIQGSSMERMAQPAQKQYPIPPLRYTPVQENPAVPSVTVTPKEPIGPVADPAQVKSYNKLMATVRGIQGDQTMANSLLKSIVQKQFGVDDPKFLGKEDLDTITSQLKQVMKK